MVVINKLHLLYKDVVRGLPQPGIRRYFIRGVPWALPSWDGPGMDIVSLVSVSWGSHEPCHPGHSIPGIRRYFVPLPSWDGPGMGTVSQAFLSQDAPGI